jgi:hypothetical protein
MKLIIIPTVISDISLMISILALVNHYVLVIGLMMKKMINAFMLSLVLKMSTIILILDIVNYGALLLNVLDQDSLMVLIVNVKFQVLLGMKNNSGVFVKLMINS